MPPLRVPSATVSLHTPSPKHVTQNTALNPAHTRYYVSLYDAFQNFAAASPHRPISGRIGALFGVAPFLKLPHRSAFFFPRGICTSFSPR